MRETRRCPLGLYRDLEFGLMLHPHGAPLVYLEGAVTCQEMLSREHHGPRAVLNALDCLIGTYDAQCDEHKEDLAIAEASSAIIRPDWASPSFLKPTSPR